MPIFATRLTTNVDSRLVEMIGSMSDGAPLVWNDHLKKIQGIRMDQFVRRVKKFLDNDYSARNYFLSR